MKSVALILDPDFGPRIKCVAREMPVWILSSPSNDPAVEQARPMFKDNARITSFVPQRADDRVGTCAQALYDIDEHHGPWSSSDPYEELRVFGASREDFPARVMEELKLVPAGAEENALVFRRRLNDRSANQ